MIKNIILDIGNVILKFNYEDVILQYTKNQKEQKFIYENIINSPEWLQYGLIDTGYISRKDAISIVQDRTNHENDELVYDFWMNCNNFASIDNNVVELIKKLKKNNYKIYLLSNTNIFTVAYINETSDLFAIVDGQVLSYLEHQIKPYESIYNTLLDRYNLNVCECLFIDDNQKNIDTAIKLGFNAKKVIPDSFESLEYELDYYLHNKI